VELLNVVGALASQFTPDRLPGTHSVCYDTSARTPKQREESSMASADNMQDLNRQLARRINQEARTNPQSPYANKFVGIADGQVVVIADEMDELALRLRQIEPDPSKTVCVEASRDYTVVEDIWELN
jgi:hypothetical protein